MSAEVDNRSVWSSLRVVLGLAGVVLLALQFFAFVDLVQTHTQRAKLQQGTRTVVGQVATTPAWGASDRGTTRRP